MSWWSGKKEEPKVQPSAQPQKSPKAPEKAKAAPLGGKVVVAKIVRGDHSHAFLARYDEKGDVFVSFEVAAKNGIQALAIGQRYEATWAKAPGKNRFDVTTLRSID
jgi:cold shock CspA family protein